MTTLQPTPDHSETVLRDVLEVLIDGQKGFSKAAEALEDDGNTELAKQMRTFAEQRQRMAAELQETASGHVTLSDVDGSTAGDLHRTWMAIKDSLTGDDAHAILAAAEEGEDHAKETYENALTEDLPAELRAVISRQASEIVAAHDKVRDLRDAHSG